MTGYAFRKMLIDAVRLSRRGGARRRTTFSTLICRLVRYEQQKGVGPPRANM